MKNRWIYYLWISWGFWGVTQQCEATVCHGTHVISSRWTIEVALSTEKMGNSPWLSWLCWWFFANPVLKNDGVKVSWGPMTFPIWRESHNPAMFQSPPTSHGYVEEGKKTYFLVKSTWMGLLRRTMELIEISKRILWYTSSPLFGWSSEIGLWEMFAFNPRLYEIPLESHAGHWLKFDKMLNLKVHHHQQGNSTKIHRYVPRALAWSWFLANTENQTAATRSWLKARVLT